MIVRTCQDSDLEPVATLFINTVRHVNSQDYSPEQIAAWAPQTVDLPHWRKRLAGLVVWVAEADGEIVGFCGLRADGYIDLLYVHHEFQRQGVAQALYAAVEAESIRWGMGLLFTDASITARPFFERMGFRVVREQQVEARGVAFRNYAMEKQLGSAAIH
jgi:putative acetyltransferase